MFAYCSECLEHNRTPQRAIAVFGYSALAAEDFADAYIKSIESELTLIEEKKIKTGD